MPLGRGSMRAEKATHLAFDGDAGVPHDHNLALPDG